MNAALAYSSSADTGLASDQLTAFVADDDTRAMVQTAVQARWPTAIIHDGGLPVALGTLSQEPSPPLLVVDISGSEDPVGAVQSLLTVCDPGTRIVILGHENDVSLYRDLIMVGAADYLVKPCQADDLARALAGAERGPIESATDAKKLRTIIVLGSRGGVGASTIAVNTAWLMAHDLGKTVALIDLDLQFGTVTLSLDLEPSHGLREAFESPDRIDGLFIASAMAHESERLFVLGSEEPLDRSISISPAAFETLLGALPEDFDCAVIDLPARLAVSQPGWLANADMVAIVSELSLAGMRDTTRLAQLVREAAPNAALTVVANKTGVPKSGELPKADFQKGTELPVKHFIPSDIKIASEAANAGRPFAVMGKRSPVVKAMRRLAEAFSGTRPVPGQGKQAAKSGLAQIFKFK